MKRAIVVVGSLNMDLVVHTPRHPQPGETILGGDFGAYPGGKGANQAVAAARLGGMVTLVGRAGKDAFGESLIQTLAQDGVSTAHVGRSAEAATGVALITVDASGQNTIVVAPGANGQLTPEDVAAAEEVFAGAGVVVMQLECPVPAVQRAVALARKHDAQVILNPAPAQPLAGSLLKDLDYLIPNQGELALLTGEADLRAAARQLRQTGVRHVAVTLGGEGVFLLDEAGEFQLPAHVVKVLDTVAAGDAFVGAFAVALTEGRPAREAAVWGNAAGALAVTRSGAQPSLPRRAELEDFLREQPA